MIKYLLCDLGGVILEVDHSLYQKFSTNKQAKESEINSEIDVENPDFNRIIKRILYKNLDMILEFVKQHNLKLGLLSNTSRSHVDIFNAMFIDSKYGGISKWCNNWFFSCYLKMRKPDFEIYDHTLKTIAVEHGIMPYEVLFIDDNGINCDAAEKLGVKVGSVIGTRDFGFSSLQAILDINTERLTGVRVDRPENRKKV